jgi:mono/diheme cytochrome c family protein
MSKPNRCRWRAWLLGTCAMGASAWLLAGGELARADEAGSTPKAGLHSPDGAELYRLICAGCHMPDARGAKGGGYYPALAGDPALKSKIYAARVLVLGRRNMPAFGEKHAVGLFFDPVKLSPEQIASVINYVRTHFGNRYRDTLTAAEVAAVDVAATH